MVGELYLNFLNYVTKKKEMAALLSDIKQTQLFIAFFVIVKNWKQPKISQYLNGQTVFTSMPWYNTEQ